MVSSGEGTSVSDVLTLNCIDDVDTVALTIYTVAIVATDLDMAPDTTDMDYTDSHDAVYAHTDADDTFQPSTDYPTATYVVTQRQRERRQE